jgi:hypothetical protein
VSTAPVPADIGARSGGKTRYCVMFACTFFLATLVVYAPRSVVGISGLWQDQLGGAKAAAVPLASSGVALSSRVAPVLTPASAAPDSTPNLRPSAKKVSPPWFTAPRSKLPTALARSDQLAACIESNMRTRQPLGLDADPELKGRPVFAVTSLTGPFARALAGRPTPFMGSLWSSPLENIPPLIVYNEDAWDEAHGREPLDATLLPVADCVVDVFDAAPNLHAALRANDSAFNAIYELPGIRSLSDDILDGKALVRKVVAIAHAAAHLPDGAILLWLDVDTSLGRRLDAKWVQMAAARDLTYIAETDCPDAARASATFWEMPHGPCRCSFSILFLLHLTLLCIFLPTHSSLVSFSRPGPCLDFRIDTGWFAIALGARTRQFFANAQRWYDGDMLAVARMCLTPTSWTPEKAAALLLPRRANEGAALPFAFAGECSFYVPLHFTRILLTV